MAATTTTPPKSSTTTWMIIAGGIVIIVIAIIASPRSQKVTPPTTRTARTETVVTPKYTVIANGQLPLSEGEWTDQPITVERTQGIEYFIVKGDADKYLVRDADNPSEIYPIVNGQVINTAGNRIHRFQWSCAGVKKAPVVMKFAVYQ